MKRKIVTPEQRNFIEENRLTLSMNDMSAHLDISYSRLRSYMIEHSLNITNEEAQRIRVDKMYSENHKTEQGFNEVEEFRPPTWIADPWNYNLNLVTMK